MENHKQRPCSIQVTHPFRHSTPLQIRFNDIDTLGHVNNTVYFSFLDLGKTHYFNEALGKTTDWRAADVVIANINCDFIAPIRFNENIEVKTQIGHIGNKSFRVLQAIVNTTTGEVKCLCATTMVGFDAATGQARVISCEWREAVSAFEGRPL